MNDILLAMRERALMDSAFRRAILATAENPDPLAALCDVAQQNGFNLTMADIISDGIAFGAIQVPSEGKPIIMLGDRQTTGGYTKIATVISADFRLLGQLKGGDKVKFEQVSIGQAQEALLNQRAAMKTLRHALDG